MSTSVPLTFRCGWRARFLCALLLLVRHVTAAVGQESGVVEGNVRGADSLDGLQGVTISLTSLDADGLFGTITDSTGYYRLIVPAGNYIARAQTLAYLPAIDTVSVSANDSTRQDFSLAPDEDFGSEPVLVTGLYNSPYFNMGVEPSYFITGFDHSGQEPSPLGNRTQVKFRVSVRYRLVSSPVHEYDTGLYAGYTQNSFWHVYESSAPFFDNNYNPSLFFHLDARDLGASAIFPSPRLAIEHESNGREGESSRSWNRLTLALDVGDREYHPLFGSVSVWRAFGLAPENPEILESVGRGELRLGLQPFLQRGLPLGVLGATLKSRILGEDPVSNVEVNLYVHPGPLAGMDWLFPSLTAQFFWGKGENLLTHNETHTAFRLGLAVVR